MDKQLRTPISLLMMLPLPIMHFVVSDKVNQYSQTYYDIGPTFAMFMAMPVALLMFGAGLSLLLRLDTRTDWRMLLGSGLVVPLLYYAVYLSYVFSGPVVLSGLITLFSYNRLFPYLTVSGVLLGCAGQKFRNRCRMASDKLDDAQ